MGSYRVLSPGALCFCNVDFRVIGASFPFRRRSVRSCRRVVEGTSCSPCLQLPDASSAARVLPLACRKASLLLYRPLENRVGETACRTRGPFVGILIYVHVCIYNIYVCIYMYTHIQSVVLVCCLCLFVLYIACYMLQVSYHMLSMYIYIHIDIVEHILQLF